VRCARPQPRPAALLREPAFFAQTLALLPGLALVVQLLASGYAEQALGAALVIDVDAEPHHGHAPRSTDRASLAIAHRSAVRGLAHRVAALAFKHRRRAA
jgi:hypothetical protein